jgi:hypothetical protein
MVGQAVFRGTVPAMHAGMARSRASERSAPDEEHGAAGSMVKIDDECLELELAGEREIDVLRGWLRRVNGPAYPQPYLVEGPPGRFRLYVGAAAERVRTRHGML